jgi:CheY-like chemotaxis protein
MSDSRRPILAAEDEESDRMILTLAFKRAQLPQPLVIVPDGEEVVNYLTGKERYADRTAFPLPALVVLDLKMPRMDGFDVLEWLAKQSDYKDLPAVVLSSSSSNADMQKARELGAKDYFVKPHSFDELIKILHEMQSRWLPS